MTVQTKKIQQTDPRLKRHIVHDSRSRNFAVPTPKRLSLKTKRHRRWGFILNQGRVGACTGFAAAHALNTEPYRKKYRGTKTKRNADGLEYYSLATTLDVWRGQYPPTDTGSSGLAVAKALQQLNLIRSYQWAFGFDHGLAGIMQAPFLQGTYWYSDMMRPDKNGLVKPTGQMVGGHEYLWLGIDTKKELSWFVNSWGYRWGKRGYFCMSWEDHKTLLDRRGDLIKLIV